MQRVQETRSQYIINIVQRMGEDDWEGDLNARPDTSIKQPLDTSPKGPFYPSRNTSQFYQNTPSSGSSTLPSSPPTPAPSPPPPVPTQSKVATPPPNAVQSYRDRLDKSLNYQ